MTKSSNATKASEPVSAGQFGKVRKSGVVLEMKPVTKRGSISQAQAERAVRAYLADTKSK